MRPGLVILLLWPVWGLSWLLAAGWSNPTAKRVGVRGELGYRVLQVLGFGLLAYPAHGYEGWMRLWHVTWVQAWLCVGLEVAGFAFCWWARIHLGRLWSAAVTKKEGHHLVDGGPYGIVRHPIYTGILIALIATVLAKGTVLGIVGGAIATLGLWAKARLEEGWLSQELGAAVYDDYRRRVPMLIPFGPRAR